LKIKKLNIPLIIITNHFPFGSGEVFFDQEFNFLNKKFNEIIIISRNIKDRQRVEIPQKTKIYRYNTKSSFKEIFKTLRNIIISPDGFWKHLFQEIIYYKKHFSDTYSYKKSINKIIHDIIKAYQIYHFIKRKKYPKTSVFYSYWLNSSALGLVFLKEKNQKTICIARGHGSDIYFEAKNNYLPYRYTITRHLDNIFLISINGYNYISNLPETKKSNLTVSKIGTAKLFRSYNWSPQEIFHIVSCSSIIKLKRVDKIVDVISELSDYKIKWTHFGDGHEMNIIKKKAQLKLTGVTYNLKGNLDNKKIQEFYANNNIDLFINLSLSEGIPVSIMEAFSYNIPALANNVGGIPEIVNNENGIIVSKDDFPVTIAQKIINYFSSPVAVIKEKRQSAFKTWEKNYMSSKNNLSFYKKIISLCNQQ